MNENYTCVCMCACVRVCVRGIYDILMKFLLKTDFHLKHFHASPTEIARSSKICRQGASELESVRAGGSTICQAQLICICIRN